MKKWKKVNSSFFAIGICVLATGVFLSAQTVTDSENLPLDARERPVAPAYKVEEAPVMDGNILDDPVWAVASPATGFYQIRPYEGQPASERTEVRIVYTKDTLYFGIICYDEDPNAIIVTEGRRDAPLGDTDNFQIILDTYLDRQNGFLFATNPAGIEYDAQVSNEGEGGGVQRWGNAPGRGGAGGGFNLNWVPGHGRESIGRRRNDRNTAGVLGLDQIGEQRAYASRILEEVCRGDGRRVTLAAHPFDAGLFDSPQERRHVGTVEIVDVGGELKRLTLAIEHQSSQFNVAVGSRSSEP